MFSGTASHGRGRKVLRCRTLALLMASALIAPAFSPAQAAEASLPAGAQSWFSASAIEDALGQAAGYGTTSFLASIVENTRLTPDRADQIKATAISLRPDLAQNIARAVDSGRHLADVYPSQSLMSAPGERALPYPGGNPDIPKSALSEFQRNYSLDAIHAQTARELGFTGKDVLVGVIDTGLDVRPDGTVHPEFEGRVDDRSKTYLYWVDRDLEGETITLEEFKAGFEQGWTDSYDVNGHGTHVAGIIGAGHNGFGMEGVAPDARILAVKAIPHGDGPVRVDLGGGVYKEFDFDDLEGCGPNVLYDECDPLSGNMQEPAIDASRYLAQFEDIAVINMSYGPGADPGELNWDIEDPDEVMAEAKALRANMDAGQILVVAAGNEMLRAPVYAENPSGGGLYPFIQPKNEGATNSAGELIYDDHGAGLDLSFTTAEALAAAEKADGIERGRIVVVVALDAYNHIADYSSHCGVAKEWCIAAPGGGQANHVDSGIYSTVPEDMGGYDNYSGTSMAAPNVSGAVAVLTEAYPTFSPAKIVDILFMTAEDLGAEGVDAVFGHGLLRLDHALSVGPVGMSGDGVYTVGAGNGDTTWLVSFESDGSLEKQGSGTLEIASAAAFKKGSSVTGGLLSVDGALATPVLTVGSKGTLGGVGVVRGDIDVSGELSPGNSPGTLTVYGDVTLNSSAVATIEVDGTGTGNGAGNYDRLILAGSGNVFTAGGTLAPQLRGISGSATNSFMPQPGELFTFVSAPDGSVAGSFDGLAQPASGLAANTRFDVLYFDNALSLAATPERYGDLAALGITGTVNETALGTAIDAARPSAGVRPDAAYNDAYNTLYAADLDALAAGLPSMTGQLHAEIGTTAVRAVGRFADAVGTRQMQLTNGLAGTGDRSAGEGTLWASGNSLSTSVGSANGLSGYDVSGGDGVFGYDWRFGQGVAGVAASYEYADVSASANGSGDVGTYQAALYGSFDAGMMTFAGRAGLGYGDLSTSRITTLGAYSATASASGHGTGGFIEAAAFSDLDMDAFTLTPSATLGYRAFHRDSMQESGSSFALAIPSETFDETQTTLAVALSKDISFDNGVRLLPAISAGWRHDYGDTGRSSTLGIFGSDFDVAGADIGADAFIGRVSVTAFADDRFTLEAAYEGEFRENLESHMFSAKASLSF